jgi:hypothetical protein
MARSRRSPNRRSKMTATPTTEQSASRYMKKPPLLKNCSSESIPNGVGSIKLVE